MDQTIPIWTPFCELATTPTRHKTTVPSCGLCGAVNPEYRSSTATSGPSSGPASQLLASNPNPNPNPEGGAASGAASSPTSTAYTGFAGFAVNSRANQHLQQNQVVHTRRIGNAVINPLSREVRMPGLAPRSSSAPVSTKT